MFQLHCPTTALEHVLQEEYFHKSQHRQTQRAVVTDAVRFHHPFPLYIQRNSGASAHKHRM